MTDRPPVPAAPPAGFRFPRLFGIPVYVHPSWFVISAVLSVVLAVIYGRDDGAGPVAAAGLGVLTTLLLFVSVAAHEMGHAVAAIRQGVEISGITLHLFGGAARMMGEPRGPAGECVIALAGPAVTVALAGVFGAVRLFGAGTLPEPALAVVGNVALMNGLLLVFNMIPALPMDGGRVLRAVLWAIWRRPRAATRGAAGVGGALGLLFIGLGALALFGFGQGAGVAQLVVGGWFVVIGMFIRRAGRNVARDLWIAEALGDVTAEGLLDYRVRSVQRQAAASDIVDLGPQFPEVPVLDDARLVGAVHLEDLHRRPSSEWPDLTAEALMRTDILDATLAREDGAVRALALLSEGRRAVAVLEAGELVGFVTMRALVRRITLRSES